ncbi:hypothetical protein OF83DRAFT_1072278 [Amylostereum chailletii]|nr:hypothetical protein OF83DRAFT_1072278 [Amylostereum chailletii]
MFCFRVQIQEYRFLKAPYESNVHWREDTDCLRCSPHFHGHPRYDFVIVDTRNHGHIFAQIHTVFTCSINGTAHPLALVQPLDAPTGARNRTERDLELLRVRTKPPAHSEFISVKSIMRGAVLVQDFDKAGDYFVVDTIDGDIFLRCRALLPQ